MDQAAGCHVVDAVDGLCDAGCSCCMANGVACELASHALASLSPFIRHAYILQVSPLGWV